MTKAVPSILNSSYKSESYVQNHDTGDEDFKTKHKFEPVTTDQMEYALGIGARGAGYGNFRSEWYRCESVHTDKCRLKTGGYFCSCILGCTK